MQDSNKNSEERKPETERKVNLLVYYEPVLKRRNQKKIVCGITVPPWPHSENCSGSMAKIYNLPWGTKFRSA